MIQLFEQRAVERDGYYRNGQIIFKGKKKSKKIIIN